MEKLLCCVMMATEKVKSIVFFRLGLKLLCTVRILDYRTAGNVCGNYILRFVVKSKVCRFNVCGLHNTSLLMHLHQNIFADKMFAEFRQNRKPQNLIPRKHFRLYSI